MTRGGMRVMVHTQRTGMTLVEVLVVVVIITILLGISVTALKHYQLQSALDTQGRTLVARLRYAEQLAVTEQIDHTVTFSTTTSTYQIIREDTPPVVIDTVVVPNPVDIADVSGLAGNQVTFNSSGVPSSAGIITLRDTSTGDTVQVEIKPAGFIRFSK